MSPNPSGRRSKRGSRWINGNHNSCCTPAWGGTTREEEKVMEEEEEGEEEEGLELPCCPMLAPCREAKCRNAGAEG